MTESAPARLREEVVAALKTCYDPEIPVDIYELGLVYDVEVSDEAAVRIKMTLTSPACPVAGSLPGEVERKVRDVEGVRSAEVELVWDPPWDQEMMSDAAKVKLGMF
ncbi:MAG TPA: SUF system Fe-S cluster assembly protein [Candidatus Polarisedimenticolaceae bacterium]|nr:SUF system Fe-S cluster assembly protein [Candidatus Polarisedimenticolaceae bacterium]